MMHNGYYWTFSNGGFPLFFQQNLFWLTPLVVIDVVLKIIAMWKAGKNNQLYWFVALAIFNTIGILPAIYLLFFQKKENKK